MSAQVSVVVCTRDRPAMLENVVASLRANLRPEDEAVVVDSASRDPSAVARIAEGAGIPVLRVESPGLSRARNAGVAATTAPIVAFTDDDCAVTDGWTTWIERAFSDPGVGFVTGRLRADSDVNVPLTAGGDHPRTFLGPDEDPEACGSGANMAFRRAALEQIGGFDELLGAGAPMRSAEDHDAFWRTLRASWTGRYEPEALVTHRQWRTRGQAIRLHYGYGVGGGAFAVKAIRLRGGWRFLRSRLWREGVAGAFRSLRSGYESGAAADLVRTVGVIDGAVRAAMIGMRDGRFVARSR